MRKFILLLILLIVAGTASASNVKFDENTFLRNSNQYESFDKKNNKQHRSFFPADTMRVRSPFGTTDFIWNADFSRYGVNHEKRDSDPFDALHPDLSGLFHDVAEGDRDDIYHSDLEKKLFGSELHDDEHDYIDSGVDRWKCSKASVNPVPAPAAAWLFVSGLAGLLRLAHRYRK